MDGLDYTVIVNWAASSARDAQAELVARMAEMSARGTDSDDPPSFVMITTDMCNGRIYKNIHFECPKAANRFRAMIDRATPAVTVAPPANRNLRA